MNKGWRKSLSFLLFVPVWSFAEALKGGLIPEDPEAYSRFPLRPVFRNVLPASKDLSAMFPPPGRQGGQSSCVGWAVGYAARSYYARKNSQSIASMPEPFSPSFIFNQTKVGGCESGSSISSALELLKNYGILGLSEFPYNPKDCSKKPTEAQLSKAKAHRIKDWARVEVSRPDTLKAEIFLGNPVIVGMWVTSSFYRFKQGVFSDLSEKSSGGHALVIVGYDDRIAAFKVLNSWGQNWGQGGYGWISYEALMERIQNAFVLLLDTEEDEASRPQAMTKSQVLSESLIRSWEQMIPCTSIQSSKNRDGLTNYAAVVGSVAARNQLADLMSSFGAKESPRIEIRPWPQCETIQTINPLLVAKEDLSVKINDKFENTLGEGDAVLIKIRQRLPMPFLSVFYVQADGRVIRLTIPKIGREGRIQNELTLGLLPHLLNVTKPLGEEVVIAFASNEPLPEALSEEVTENGKEFFLRLRQAIDLGPYGDRIAAKNIYAAYAILHTH